MSELGNKDQGMNQANATSTLAPAVPGDLLAEVRQELLAVEARLQAELQSEHPSVDRVVRHGYRLGGKRLRPALLLLSGKASGQLSPAHETLAVVVEMIHTATLVHDDILDEAQLRRHVDTINARWGNETSVLLGDFLFSHAFYLASTLGTVDACQLIGRSTNRVCEGEMRQTLSEGDLDLSEEDYFAIIDAKTAELCACCCELGARYAGATPDTSSALASYGRNLGIAFQIADDLLDLAGKEETTGKSLGRDLAKRKLTLPLIHARDTLVDGPRRAFLASVEAGDTTAVAQQLDEVGSLAYAQQKACDYAHLAASQLGHLPASPARDVLEQLAQFAVARSS